MRELYDGSGRHEAVAWSVCVLCAAGWGDYAADGGCGTVGEVGYGKEDAKALEADGQFRFCARLVLLYGAAALRRLCEGQDVAL